MYGKRKKSSKLKRNMRLAPVIYAGFQDMVTGQDNIKKPVKMGRMVGINQMAKLMQNDKFNIF